jgi:hypothetical protein
MRHLAPAISDFPSVMHVCWTEGGFSDICRNHFRPAFAETSAPSVRKNSAPLRTHIKTVTQGADEFNALPAVHATGLIPLFVLRSSDGMTLRLTSQLLFAKSSSGM